MTRQISNQRQPTNLFIPSNDRTTDNSSRHSSLHSNHNLHIPDALLPGTPGSCSDSVFRRSSAFSDSEVHAHRNSLGVGGAVYGDRSTGGGGGHGYEMDPGLIQASRSLPGSRRTSRASHVSCSSTGRGSLGGAGRNDSLDSQCSREAGSPDSLGVAAASRRPRSVSTSLHYERKGHYYYQSLYDYQRNLRFHR